MEQVVRRNEADVNANANVIHNDDKGDEDDEGNPNKLETNETKRIESNAISPRRSCVVGINTYYRIRALTKPGHGIMRVSIKTDFQMWISFRMALLSFCGRCACISHSLLLIATGSEFRICDASTNRMTDLAD